MKKKIIILLLLIHYKNVYAKIDSELLQNTKAVLINFEGMKLKAYKDGALYHHNKKITNYSIGAGMAYYSNGEKVKKRDKITNKKAMQELDKLIINIDNRAMKYKFYNTSSMLQKTAIISLIYNLGWNGFMSTKIPVLIASYNALNYIKYTSEADYTLELQEIENIVLNELLQTFLSDKATKKNNSLLSRRLREFQLCLN